MCYNRYRGINKISTRTKEKEKNMNAQDTVPQLLSTTEAGKRLGVARMTIVRWINGEGGVTEPLPAKKIGRGYRISESDLMNWIKWEDVA